jgi:hypothetical protein
VSPDRHRCVDPCDAGERKFRPAVVNMTAAMFTKEFVAESVTDTVASVPSQLPANPPASRPAGSGIGRPYCRSLLSNRFLGF